MPPKKAAGASKPELSDAESRLHGEAHKCFEKYAKSFKTDKKSSTKTPNLSKPLLTSLMENMVREQRIRFTSKQHLRTFVDENFVKYDTNQNGYLSLEEFVHLCACAWHPRAPANTPAGNMD